MYAHRYNTKLIQILLLAVQKRPLKTHKSDSFGSISKGFGFAKPNDSMLQEHTDITVHLEKKENQ